MNKIFVYKTVFLAVVLWSCSKPISQTQLVTSFPANEIVQGEEIKIPPVLLAPDGMVASEDMLIVSDYKQDSIFYSFELPSHRYLGANGIRGQGPNDFVFPDGRTLLAYPGGFSILDVGSYSLKEVKWTPGQFEVHHREVLRKGEPAVNGFLDLGEGKVCVLSQPGVDIDTEYRIIDTNTFESVEVSPYPTLTDNYTKEEPGIKARIYRKEGVVKPDKSRFAYFYTYFKFFRIHDRDGNLLKEVNVQVEPYNKEYEQEYEKSMQYYMSPKATDKYIYVMCLNLKGGEQLTSTAELQVWDWDGNPVGKYTLDKVIYLFTISEKHGKLYGIHPLVEDTIYAFDLPVK